MDLAIDASGADHLWVVDSRARSIYRYDGGESRVSDAAAFDAVFALNASNQSPQGIVHFAVAPSAAAAAMPIAKSGSDQFVLPSARRLPDLQGLRVQDQPIGFEPDSVVNSVSDAACRAAILRTANWMDQGYGEHDAALDEHFRELGECK
jgi:hypothetical protein